MANRIRFISFLLIIAILVSACVSVNMINGQTVKAVSGVKMESNSSSSVVIKWDEVKKSDGYYIYHYNADAKTYKRLDKLSGCENCSYELKNLPGATVYDIKVNAYKIYFGKEYESKEAEKIRIYSLPDALDVSAFSGGKGILSIEWETSENLSGFEIEYSENIDFKPSKKVRVEHGETRNTSVDGLSPGKKYYVRGRAYLIQNKDTVFGSWGNIANAVINKKDLHIGDINPNKPMVALTFDDGPAFTYNKKNSTGKILDVLEKNNARATFFMVGERVNNDTKALLQREIELGCELGNHTIAHTHYGDNVTASDISKASKRIRKYCGKAPTVFRCPGGNLTSIIRKECKKENMPLAYWSVDTEDWKSQDASKIYKKVINQTYDGAIILMHDIYPSTAEAIEMIVPKLIKKGYQLVTVSEMIEAKTGNAPKPGEQYLDYETIDNNTK